MHPQHRQAQKIFVYAHTASAWNEFRLHSKSIPPWLKKYRYTIGEVRNKEDKICISRASCKPVFNSSYNLRTKSLLFTIHIYISCCFAGSNPYQSQQEHVIRCYLPFYCLETQISLRWREQANNVQRLLKPKHTTATAGRIKAISTDALSAASFIPHACSIHAFCDHSIVVATAPLGRASRCDSCLRYNF